MFSGELRTGLTKVGGAVLMKSVKKLRNSQCGEEKGSQNGISKLLMSTEGSG